MPTRLTLSILFISQLLLSPYSFASDSSNKIDRILSQQEAPTGIVFEIVSADVNLLNKALPRTQQYIKKLRAKFPGLEIAIVTHGNEQFALKSSNNKKFKKVHSITKQLVDQEKVPLHVCGTYAGMKNVSEEEFPAYVDVTAAGPATINDYVALGYTLIKIK